MGNHERWLERADRLLLLASLAILLFGAAGGAWSGASDHALMAGRFERSAGAPLYGALASIATLLPIGEPWFRVAALDAVLGAVLLVGVARAARTLLPKDPVAGYVAALALVLTPPFRDAAGFPGPSILAACGVVWLCVFALAHAREPGRERAWWTLAMVAVVLGSAPWLGAPLGVLAVAWLARAEGRRDELALGVGAIGVLVVAWWLGATGDLPELDPDLTTTVAATGRGAASVVVGAGLLGLAFAAATGLPRARWIVGVAAIACGHAAAVDHAPIAVLAMFALGLAVIPSGVVRAVPGGPERRHAIAAIVGAPLIGAALLSGPAFGVDDPGHAPARVASELTIAIPPGPGVFAATRPQTWSALAYAQAIAGTRPDLALLAAAGRADGVLGDALRAGRMVGADVPAFGRLDPRLAYPRGRAYQLLPTPPPPSDRAVPVPARYTSEIGEQLAVLLAVDRARFEAGNGRLGAAARAAGLTDRFGAADLAILATTLPSRPAFFGFIPALDELPPGSWLIDLLGDDLAWVAGIDVPLVDGPRERVLHALWRQWWSGAIKPDDPQIAALGPAAVRATAELVETLHRK